MTASRSSGSHRAAIVVTVGLLGGLALWIGWRVQEATKAEAARAAQRAGSAEAARRRVPVPVATATSASFTEAAVVSGSLVPVQAADLSFEVGGRLATVSVALGAVVGAGDVLASLDRQSVSAQRAQTLASVSVAEAQLTMAEDRLRRVQSMAQAGAAAEAERVGAQQQVALAQAQLDAARASTRLVATATSNHVLRAPFAGVVTRVPSGPGAVVGPGQAVFRIEDLSTLLLRGTVGETELDAVRVDASARIEGPSVRGQVVGRVRSVVRSLDPQTRRAPVEIVVDNPTGVIVGNALVRAFIDGDARAAVLIPPTALRPDGSVVVVHEGRVAIRPVEARTSRTGEVFIVGGLAVGEQVVVRPAATMRNGDEVAVSENTAGAEARAR